MRPFADRGIPAAFIAALMVASAFAQDLQEADEERIALDKIPPAVKAKADEAAPGAKFTQAYQDKAKGFRLFGKNDAGATVVVKTSEQGALVSFETRTPAAAKSIPRAVTKALDAERRKVPTLRGFRPQSVDKADVFEASKGKIEPLYEFRGLNGQGDPVQVDVTPEGQVRPARVIALHPDSGKADDAAAAAKDSPLPPQIAEAVQMAVPGFRIQGSKVDKSVGGITTYVVNGRDENSGTPTTVEANPNGVVMTVRYDLNAQSVPPQAQELVAQRAANDPMLAGFRPQKVQRLELRQLGSTALAFQGRTTKGTNVEVRVGIESGEVSVIPLLAAPAADDTAKAADDSKTTGKKTSRGKRSR